MSESKVESSAEVPVARSLALEDAILDAMCLYDEEVREFFLDCRIFLSLLSFNHTLFDNSVPIDNSIFEQIQNYAKEEFVPKLLQKYNEELSVFGDSEEKVAGSNRGNVGFFKGGPTKLSNYFKYALTKTINDNIKRRSFMFNPVAIRERITADLHLQRAIMVGFNRRASFFREKIKANNPKENLLSRYGYKQLIELWEPRDSKIGVAQKYNPILNLNPKAVALFFALILLGYWENMTPFDLDAITTFFMCVFTTYFFMQQKRKDSQSLTTLNSNMLYVWLYIITLYNTGIFSFKGSLFNFCALVVALFFYDVNFAISSKDEALDLIGDLSKIKSFRKRKNDFGDLPARDIIFDEITDREISEEKEQKIAGREEKQPESVDEEDRDDGVKKQKIKTRPVVAAPIGDAAELKKTRIIHFESLGPSAIYNPDSEYDPKSEPTSTVFPCSAFSVRNVFVHIASDLSDELEQLEDKSIASKFKGVVAKANNAGMQNEQGNKMLTGKFVRLGKDNFLPCFELKPEKKHGNKRLLGCRETIEVNGEKYEVIVYREYLPDAHLGKGKKLDPKKLDAALTRLQKKVNKFHQAPVAASRRAAA